MSRRRTASRGAEIADRIHEPGRDVLAAPRLETRAELVDVSPRQIARRDQRRRRARARCTSRVLRARRTPPMRPASQESRRSRASEHERGGRRHHRRARECRRPRSGCSAAVSSAPDASVTTTGRRAARSAVRPAVAMSTQTPRVSTPAASSAPIASARIDSYEPGETITCRWSLAALQTTTAAAALPQRPRASRRFQGPTAAARQTTGRASRPPPALQSAAGVDFDDPARIRRQFDADRVASPPSAARRAIASAASSRRRTRLLRRHASRDLRRPRCAARVNGSLPAGARAG